MNQYLIISQRVSSCYILGAIMVVIVCCKSNYLCNQCLLPLRRGVLDTTLCDKICQWLAAGRWFSSGTLVSSTNKTDYHDITEILLKVAFSTINHHHHEKKRVRQSTQLLVQCSIMDIMLVWNLLIGKLSWWNRLVWGFAVWQWGSGLIHICWIKNKYEPWQHSRYWLNTIKQTNKQAWYPAHD